MLNKVWFTVIWLLIFTTIALSQDQRPLIYIPFAPRGNKIKILDAQTFQVIAEIPMDEAIPETIVLRNDERIAFALNDIIFSGTGMSVVDLVNRTKIKTILDGVRIVSIKLGFDDKLYALLPDAKQIAVINTQTFVIEKNIQLGNAPAAITFTKDGTKAYVLAGNFGFVTTGPIFEVDLVNNLVIRTLNNLPEGQTRENDSIILSPDEQFIYVARNLQVTVVDRISLGIAGSLPGTQRTMNLQISPDGKTLYALDTAELDTVAKLLIIDIPSRTVIKEIRVPTGFRYMKLSLDGRILYGGDESLLAAIETKTNITIAEYEAAEAGLADAFALAGDFNSTIPPAVKFTGLKDGDTIQKGKLFTFKWQTTPGSSTIANHVLELSLDGGQTFIQMGGFLDSTTQEFTYQVPIVPFENVQARITATDIIARKATSLVSFKIGDGMPGNGDNQAPTVNFTKPTGGEKFNAGDTINITWNSSDNVGVTSQDLALSTDGGSTFPITIASGLTGAVQSFNYQIPSSLQTSSARLRLVVRDAAGNSAQSITASNFQVQNAPPVDTQAPTITFSSPSPSTNIFPAGQAITVNWVSVDNVGVMSQELLLSLDGGASFQSLATFDGARGTFTLNNIPNLDKTISAAAVKITAIDAAGNKGEQTATFTLTPAIGQVTFTKPTLTITGNGFTSSTAQSTLKVFINGKEVVAKFITASSNTSITVKGNKKKLGLIKGSNSVKITVNNIESNTMSFTF